MEITRPPDSLDKITWRVGLAARKVFGRSPELSWGEIALAMTPERFWERWQRAVRRVPPNTDSLSVVRREGPLVLWGSRFGPVWARYTDGPAISAEVDEVMDRRAYDLPPVSVREEDVVIDAGANLGGFTRFALRRWAKKVIAFESDPARLEGLHKTFAREIAAGSVELVDAATCRTPAKPRPAPGANGHELDQPSPDGIAQSYALRIDDALDKLGVEHVDFIKIDLRGGERQALTGATRTIRRSRPRMAVSTCHLPDDVQILPEVVAEILPEYRTLRRRDHDYYYCE